MLINILILNVENINILIKTNEKIKLFKKKLDVDEKEGYFTLFWGKIHTTLEK